jgi:hypothetical protein
MADNQQPTQSEPTAGQVARNAAVKEIVSTGVYLAVMIGFTIAISKRDALARARMRAERVFRPRPPAWHDGLVAELRTELSRADHDPDWGPPC